MKKIFLNPGFFKLLLVIAVFFCSSFHSKGQQTKPANSGYAPVNGIKVYYEVYGEGEPKGFTMTLNELVNLLVTLKK